MYINPILVGIVGTLLVEAAVLIVFSVWSEWEEDE